MSAAELQLALRYDIVAAAIALPRDAESPVDAFGTADVYDESP